MSKSSATVAKDTGKFVEKNQNSYICIMTMKRTKKSKQFPSRYTFFGKKTLSLHP